MTVTELRASVILCAYTMDRWDELVAAVASIHEQETPAGELILVVDHNHDLYQRALLQFPGTRVVENRAARGLSGARNTGVELARFPIVAFMDEDAVAERDWLTRLLETYQDEQVIGAGGAVEPNWIDGRPDWFPAEFGWVVGCTYKGLPEASAPIRNLLGCNMSFRRSIFISSGGFRNTLGRQGGKFLTSCEETEFCIRANRAYPHSRFIYEPTARVRHKVPGPRTSWGYFRSRCYAEGFSKSLVASFVGGRDGLASERSYTLRVLPGAIFTGLKDSLVKWHPAGLLRAGAVIMGVALTGFGYLAGQLTTHPANQRTSPVKSA